MNEVVGVILGILFFILMIGHRVSSGEIAYFPMFGEYKCKPLEKVKRGGE